MARKQPTNIGFSQKLKAEYWDWTKEEKENYLGDTKAMMKNICKRIHDGLVDAGADADELKFKFSGIEHDKDTKILHDPEKEIDVIEQKETHIHGFVELVKKRDLNVIAKWIGIEPQFIEIPKGRYGRENMLAYLIHAKSPEKYRYDAKDVETFGTWDYMAYYREKYRSWEEYRATASVKNNKTKVDWLVKQVQLGKISMTEIMKNENYKMVYADNMRLIKDAQQFLNEERAYRTIEALENNEFELSVHFVTGLPGAGKSHFADLLCRKLENEHGWRTYPASGTNPMDNYTGEEILFLDDLRSSSMTATDWLKMLDHLSRSAMSARYSNKGRAYRTIIMTAYEEPYKYFSYMKGTGGTDEALAQFIRRLMYTIKLYKMDDGKRVALVEEIVQGKTRTYHLGYNDFISDDTRLSFGQQKDVRRTNFFGKPVALLPVENAVDGLAKIISEKNDPERDHSNTERLTEHEHEKRVKFVNQTDVDLDDLKKLK